MPRETKAQLAARVAADNAAAAAIPTGTTAQDSLFGTVILGENRGPDPQSGWDQYEVRHSGFTHTWSSAVVARAFTATATTTTTEEG